MATGESGQNGVAKQKGQTSARLPRSPKLDVPAKFTAEDLLKAVKVVNDKGGKGQPKELQALFGDGVTEKETLSRALAFATKLGLLSKEGNSYVIQEPGRNLLSSSDADRKQLLAPKLLSQDPYRTVLQRMENEEDNSLSKTSITELWAQIAGGGGINIRAKATTTFASLCQYAGMIDSSRSACKLTEYGMTSLKGGTGTPSDSTANLGEDLTGTTDIKTPTRDGLTDTSAREICPRCDGNNLGILDENVVEYFVRGNKTLLLVKYNYLCRECHQQFSRMNHTSIDGVRSQPHR